MSDIWLLVVFLIPVVLLSVLRVNAVMVYLGLCLGYVVSLFDDNNKEVTKLAATKVIHQLGGSNDIRLILLLLPPVIITLFMLKTAKGGKYSINLLPSIAVGILAIITVVPLLPTSTAVTIMNSSLWQDVTKYEGALVAISAAVVVVLLITQHSKLSPHSKSSKHHKSKD
jgi:hypothetical protein